MKRVRSARQSKFGIFSGIAAILFLFFCVAPLSSTEEPIAQPLVMDLKLDGEVEPVLATYIDEGLTAPRSARLPWCDHHGHARRPQRFHEGYHPAHSRFAGAGGGICRSDRRAWSVSGFFHTFERRCRAMAPGTRTGAASPIIAIGGFTIGVDEVLRKKITNDAMAFLRSYSEKRGRNAKLAETAVTDATAFTEKESLDGKLIDYVAATPEELLRDLNGKTVTRFDGTKTTLALTNYQRASFELSAQQKFLARMLQPDMFFLLLILGSLGLYAEFAHSRSGGAGRGGGICAVLALYAMHLLPVNVAGVLLIVIAVTLFALEAKYTSHGILLAGGVIAMIFGAIFLIRSPLTQGGVSLGMAFAVTLPFAVLSVFLMRLVLRSRRWKPAAGAEEMLRVNTESPPAA